MKYLNDDHIFLILIFQECNTEDKNCKLTPFCSEEQKEKILLDVQL